MVDTGCMRRKRCTETKGTDMTDEEVLNQQAAERKRALASIKAREARTGYVSHTAGEPDMRDIGATDWAAEDAARAASDAADHARQIEQYSHEQRTFLMGDMTPDEIATDDARARSAVRMANNDYHEAQIVAIRRQARQLVADNDNGQPWDAIKIAQLLDAEKYHTSQLVDDGQYAS